MNKNSHKKYSDKNQGEESRDKKKLTIIMPIIDDYPSRKEWETVCWQKILESKESLQLLITSHERHDIIMRAAVLNALASDKSYRQIGRELWLSPQTISVIKKAISEKSYQSYFNRSKKERKKRKYSSSPATIKSIPRDRPRRTKYGTIYQPF